MNMSVLAQCPTVAVLPLISYTKRYTITLLAAADGICALLVELQDTSACGSRTRTVAE